jgi:hypothetical protein
MAAAYGALLPWARSKGGAGFVLVALFVTCVGGLVFGQMLIYEAMTGVRNAIHSDNFVAAIIFLENIASAAVLFLVLKRRQIPPVEK